MIVEELRKEPATAFLILVNVLVFVAVEFTGGSQNTQNMLKWGAAYTPMILEQGQVYRMFTSIFLHFGMSHLANNMLVLFVLGGRLERVTGKIKFLLIYFAGGIGGNILSLYLDTKNMEFAVSAGASGAIFAVMGAMIYAIIRQKGRIEDLSARQIIIMAAFSLYFGFTSSGVDNAAHVGGLICGFLAAVLLYHPRNMRNTEP
ncbi:MAG: rhomboid family intramembrane serine protease [Eubacteriales bacterium]|nr:rhomboid family intramembrane serine protease [Eubacteriales bacterium]